MPTRLGRAAAFGACCLVALALSACKLLQPATCCDEEAGCPQPYHLHRPKLPDDPTMMSLAHDLDCVEKHIEWYGSVVPKTPDVWGQARLTKHREEFEEQMAVELSRFDVKLNGALTRADSAFFAQALALSAAVQPGPRTLLGGTRTRTDNARFPAQQVNINGLQGTREVEDRITQTATTTQATILPPPAVISTVPATSPATGATTAKTEGGVTTVTTTALNTATVPEPKFDAAIRGTPRVRLPEAAIGLEPTLVLEQKARYLNLLNQIRRTNEGDDTADSPGYSLNLVRIPVSVLPGKKTEEGHGAEITFTLTPVLSDELLPMTFRGLVINDLTDQLAFPLVRYLESPDARLDLVEEYRPAIRAIADGRDQNVLLMGDETATGNYKAIVDQLKKRLVIPSLAPVKGLQGRQPVPNSQMIDVYGLEFCFEIAFQAHRAFERSIRVNGYAHMPDVQSFLLSELSAAYRLLAEPVNQGLWASFCTPELVTAVRTRDYAGLIGLRRAFRSQLGGSPSLTEKRQDHSITAALAWCILVDSALLTDRLVQDMKETATARGCAPFCGGWLDFAHPAPSAEARHAFNAYVRCRWPIRVFALDPANQDQNLADELSTRRETQLALSLAFVSGQINANSLTRYARRLEAQYETIALNRTQVGFSHGEDTFGWRFTPRFQSPDTESNLTVLFRDQLVGGPRKDALLRQRRLEPGPRECVAIVMMPSFVPYVTCDSVSNWFSLTNPKNKKFDHTDAVRASRAIKALQVNGPKVGDADCYRPGEHARLLRRIDQLEARLPTQTATVQVPMVNTLGGFEMFNNGTTDLAPELHGFYGAPGARVDDPTTLFLVGDHFSPLRTRVIVGNKECPAELLSRQVVKVTVPPLVLPTNDNFVRAHLATPYGVSREIEVPLARPLGEPREQLALDEPFWNVRYAVRKAPKARPEDPDVYEYVLLSGTAPEVSRLTWLGPPAARPAEVEVTVGFVVKGAPVTYRKKVPLTNGAFPLSVLDIAGAALAAHNANDPPKSYQHQAWAGTLVPPVFTVTRPGSPDPIPLLLPGGRKAPELRALPAAPAQPDRPGPPDPKPREGE